MSGLEMYWEEQMDRRTLHLRRGEEFLSGLKVFPLRLRIGRAQVRVGGIGDVYTEEKHRLQGHSARCMRHAVERMRQDGFDLSLLFGIPDFYHRFGYAPVMAEPLLYVPTDALLGAAGPYAVRDVKRTQDSAAMLRLYNRDNAARSGTAVRPRGYRFRSGLVAVDGRDRIVGYMRWASPEPARFAGLEMAADDPAAWGSLARALGRRARRRGVCEVRFRLPLDHGFGRYCAGLGCRWETEHFANAGPMARILNMQGLFKKLCPELARRLQAVGSAWKGSLVLDTEIDSVALAIDGGAVVLAAASRRAAVVRLPQTALGRLVLGYAGVEDLAGDPEVKIPLRSRSVIEALFPQSHPYMWNADRF